MSDRLLLLITFALSAYGTGQVWLVQISGYPLWKFVSDDQFHAYHNAWWRSIWGVILAPAGLLCLCALMMLKWRTPITPAWSVWLGIGMQLILLVGTALWWGPLMARLEQPQGGVDPHRFHVLLNSHWMRVALVSFYSVLLAWMVFLNLGA